MATEGQRRLLNERSIEAGVASSASTPNVRPVRSVTVNGAESPLGWLLARGLVTRRQYDGERVGAHWDRAALDHAGCCGIDRCRCCCAWRRLLFKSNDSTGERGQISAAC